MFDFAEAIVGGKSDDGLVQMQTPVVWGEEYKKAAASLARKRLGDIGIHLQYHRKS